MVFYHAVLIEFNENFLKTVFRIITISQIHDTNASHHIPIGINYIFYCHDIFLPSLLIR